MKKFTQIAKDALSWLSVRPSRSTSTTRIHSNTKNSLIGESETHSHESLDPKTKKKRRKFYGDEPHFVYLDHRTEKWLFTRFFEKIPTISEYREVPNYAEASHLKDYLNRRDGFGGGIISKAKTRAVDLRTRRAAVWSYNQLIEQGHTKTSAAKIVGFARKTLATWLANDGDRCYDPRGLDLEGEIMCGNDGIEKSFARDAYRNGKSPGEMGREAILKMPKKVPSHIKHYRLLVKAEELARSKGISMARACRLVSKESGLKEYTILNIHDSHRVHEKGTLGSGWNIWNSPEHVAKWHSQMRKKKG